jgi:hypothetical protein
MIPDLGGGGGTGIVLDSLARAQDIWDLSLLSDAEFISTLSSKVLGILAQILGEHLTGGSNWCRDQICLGSNVSSFPSTRTVIEFSCCQ